MRKNVFFKKVKIETTNNNTKQALTDLEVQNYDWRSMSIVLQNWSQLNPADIVIMHSYKM